MTVADSSGASDTRLLFLAMAGRHSPRIFPNADAALLLSSQDSSKARPYKSADQPYFFTLRTPEPCFAAGQTANVFKPFRIHCAMSASSLALNNLRAFVILIVLGFHSVLAYLGSLPATQEPFDSPPFRWQAIPIATPNAGSASTCSARCKTSTS